MFRQLDQDPTFHSLHPSVKWCNGKEMTTCMLEAKGLAANLWAKAMNVAAHIHNIVPHSSVKGKTPFESYFGHK